jgi:hypothetical protein
VVVVICVSGDLADRPHRARGVLKRCCVDGDGGPSAFDAKLGDSGLDVDALDHDRRHRALVRSGRDQLDAVHLVARGSVGQLGVLRQP